MPATPARAARDASLDDVTRDAGRAANEAKYTEFRMACDEGHAASCVALGEWWAMMRGDFARAADLYGPACLAQPPEPTACLQLGVLLAEGRPGVARAPEAAAAAFSRGCEAGSARACAEGGAALVRGARAGDDAPVARAGALFSAGCAGGGSTTHAHCCGLLAALALSPRTARALPPALTPPPAALAAHLERACAGEHAGSCLRLAGAVRRGELGFAADAARADALEVRALLWAGVGEKAAAAAVARKRAAHA
jgi:TPR repeat protein